eukprot:CAMPEP_0170569158 /NCGR_PEP_ID=MMETSP0224-20130122/378_1 /TAXON_ID=285029 /ORGANISM="Togula jolla, Strain CCCM 725" /LENGTH=440 /DNA_ID=CAMNT_0010891251 /DNA_START=14 /DNA_END=1332 /DNA_ORIENTATION=-
MSTAATARVLLPQLTSATFRHGGGQLADRTSRHRAIGGLPGRRPRAEVFAAAGAAGVACAATRGGARSKASKGARRAPPAAPATPSVPTPAASQGPRRGLHRAGTMLSKGSLEVAEGLSLGYQEHGNKDGVPAVFLHGGPGAGASQRMSQLFDLDLYRVILFDQRGCDSSKWPGGSAEQLQDNTTWHLVEDLEAIRVHFGIDRWVVGGGSWGTCLALAYASRHADRVLGMALRAACLFRDEEFDFFLGPGPGARTANPEAWKKLMDWLPWVSDATPPRELAAAFRDAVLGLDASLSPKEAVSRWSQWEGRLMSTRAPWPDPRPPPGSQKQGEAEESVARPPVQPPAKPWPAADGRVATQMLLTMHYVAEGGFFPPGFSLLDAAAEFRFPLEVIHGRHDCVCPARNAVDLTAVVPDSQLHLTDGGHSQWDPANVDAFVRAT